MSQGVIDKSSHFAPELQLADVKLKNTGKSLVLKSVIQQQIIQQLQLLPDLPSLKNDQELTKTVCNLVETAIKNNKKKKINKKSLVIDILATVFRSNDGDKDIIGKQIEFLFNNGDIKGKTIKKVVIGVVKQLPKLIGKFF